jgi:hypothetical protein
LIFYSVAIEVFTWFELVAILLVVILFADLFDLIAIILHSVAISLAD